MIKTCCLYHKYILLSNKLGSMIGTTEVTFSVQVLIVLTIGMISDCFNNSNENCIKEI